MEERLRDEQLLDLHSARREPLLVGVVQHRVDDRAVGFDSVREGVLAPEDLRQFVKRWAQPRNGDGQCAAGLSMEI